MRTMSELEKEELTNRVKGMSEEEMRLAASALPSEILVNEIGLRLLKNEQKMSRMAQMLG